MVSTTKFSNDISQLSPVIYTEIMDSLTRAKTNSSSHWGHAEMKSPLCNYEHKTKLEKNIFHKALASRDFGLRKAVDILPGSWQVPPEVPVRKTTDLLRIPAQTVISVTRDTTVSTLPTTMNPACTKTQVKKKLKTFTKCYWKHPHISGMHSQCRMSSLPWNFKPVHWTWWAGQPQKAPDTRQASYLS